MGERVSGFRGCILWVMGIGALLQAPMRAQSIASSERSFEGIVTKGLELSSSAPMKRLRRAWGRFMLPVADIEKAKRHWRLHLREDTQAPIDSSRWVYSSWSAKDAPSAIYVGVRASEASQKTLHMLKGLLRTFARQYRWRHLSKDFYANEKAIARATRSIFRIERKQARTKDAFLTETQSIPIQRLRRALRALYKTRKRLQSALASPTISL